MTKRKRRTRCQLCKLDYATKIATITTTVHEEHNRKICDECYELIQKKKGMEVLVTGRANHGA